MEAPPSNELPVQNEVPPVKYEILTGFYRAGEHVSDEKMRKEYLRHTRKLIDTIAEEKPDFVIYLDKSARPVSWMVDALWDEFSGGAQKPATRFLNIDREQWRDQVGSSETTIDAGRLDRQRIHELRVLFSAKPVRDTSVSGRVTKIDAQRPTIFDGKKVMIVDEVRSTGDTLAIAQAILKEAFPETQIIGKYWLTPMIVTLPGGTKVNAEVPVWYSENSVMGRGVGNRDSQESARSSNSAQRIGRFFLSTRHQVPDDKASQLRQEIKRLASDAPLIEGEKELLRKIQRYQQDKLLGRTSLE